MMTAPKLTPAQQRALDWLPKDGSWRTLKRGEGVSYHELRFFLDMQSGGEYVADARFDGSNFTNLRLTPAGLAMFHPEPESEKP